MQNNSCPKSSTNVETKKKVQQFAGLWMFSNEGGESGSEKKNTITLRLKLTYPEFHFETVTEVDSLTDVQQYKGNYVLRGCLQYSRTLCLGH